jgi:hypothetical protein
MKTASSIPFVVEDFAIIAALQRRNDSFLSKPFPGQLPVFHQ